MDSHSGIGTLDMISKKPNVISITTDKLDCLYDIHRLERLGWNTYKEQFK
jgi:hypothetical protein